MGKKKGPVDDTPFGQSTWWLDNAREGMVSLMEELTKREAVGPVNGGPGEVEKADFLEGWLAENGFPESTRLNAPDDGSPRPNIYLRIPGKDSSRCLWFMSHLDVVPAGDREAWKSDPFELRVEGDKMVARGVEDNHQGLVSSVFAARSLLEGGFEPACDVGLLFVADEETGSEFGIRWLMDNHRSLFGPDDSFMVPDAGNEDGSMVEVAEKAILWLKVRTVGRQIHASTPNLGKNAFFAASKLVVRLKDLYDRFDARDPIFDPPMSTFEPTKKEPNVENINTIPGEDVFHVDCRILPQISVEEVLAVFRKMADEVARDQGVVMEVSVVVREDAARATPSDAPLVKAVIRSVDRVYHVRAKPKGIGGGTVAAHLRKAGYPAVVWSRMDETGHQPNEYAWIPNMIGDAQVFMNLMVGDKKKG